MMMMINDGPFVQSLLAEGSVLLVTMETRIMATSQGWTEACSFTCLWGECVCSTTLRKEMCHFFFFKSRQNWLLSPRFHHAPNLLIELNSRGRWR